MYLKKLKTFHKELIFNYINWPLYFFSLVVINYRCYLWVKGGSENIYILGILITDVLFLFVVFFLSKFVTLNYLRLRKKSNQKIERNRKGTPFFLVKKKKLSNLRKGVIGGLWWAHQLSLILPCQVS